MNNITVREYARLTTRPGMRQSLDLAYISQTAFDWLCQLQSGWGRDTPALVHLDGYHTIRLDSYVGILESPCGTRIEILPKIHENSQNESQSREFLYRMLCTVWDLPTREAQTAHLRTFSLPLAEWLIHHFLHALSLLLSRGLSSDYIQVEEEQNVIRGQVNMARQMRQLPHRQHRIHIRHNRFSMDRPENRLIRSTLLSCLHYTRNTDNWQLAASLNSWMHEIPASQELKKDFQQWQRGRHMTHYSQIKPWCELILNHLLPAATVGEWQGISLLFPMEKLFEAFVACALRKKLYSGAQIRTQSFEKHLCLHRNKQRFKLGPDILVEHMDRAWVLDTKWKLLDLAKRNYGLAEQDFYQLFAYAHHYVGSGELALIYPKTDRFIGLSDPFFFSQDLKLYVLAFDLMTGMLELPAGGLSGFPLQDSRSICEE